jgi:hypothetical protein
MPWSDPVTNGGDSKMAIPPHQKILLTRDEAAAMCSMCVRTFLANVARKKLPEPVIKTQSGRGQRWSRAQIEQSFSVFS